MIRKKNLYRRPMKAFEAGRIKEENALKAKYGLKNKTEIWKTQAKIDYYRGRAKALARAPIEEQEVLFKKLKAIGLQTDTMADILGLQVEDLLERRLSTVVVKRKLATTPKQARQMITHKKILVNGKVVSAPGYIVPVADESSIAVKKKNKKPKPAPKEEAPTEASTEQPSENTEAPAQEEPKEEEKTE